MNPRLKLTHRAAHEVDLQVLCASWTGTSVRDLVRDELRSTRDLVGALADTLAGFDERERTAFDLLKGEVCILAAEPWFWEADAGKVMRDTCARYVALLSKGGRRVYAPECHAALGGVILTLAFMVARKRALQRLSRIRKRLFRW